MKGVVSGFVQKRIKPISSGMVKTGKKPGGKNRFGKNCQPCLIYVVYAATRAVIISDFCRSRIAR